MTVNFEHFLFSQVRTRELQIQKKVLLPGFGMCKNNVAVNGLQKRKTKYMEKQQSCKKTGLFLSSQIYGSL